MVLLLCRRKALWLYKDLVPLAEGAASVLLSHSTHFRCSKIPLCGRRAWHSKGITHSGVQQCCRRSIPPVQAQWDSLSPLSPFLYLQAIITASASFQMLISAAHVSPRKSLTRSSSAATWNPMVMRWWQTRVVTPFVSQIQTFRLQFKGSCIPVSYSLKLAYLVSKLWSHPLWGVLCAALRE